MKLSFNLTKTQTAIIYAQDDPEYIIGGEGGKETFKLTAYQDDLKRKFMCIVGMVRKKNIPVNPDNLIEGIKDYFHEERLMIDLEPNWYRTNDQRYWEDDRSYNDLKP